jgi:iron complex outermembrane recepter protein
VGTNTVNGVINIITKSSMDTKGGRISIGGGSTHPGDYLARYGGKLGSNAAYRAFGHYSDFNPLTFGTPRQMTVGPSAAAGSGLTGIAPKTTPSWSKETHSR